MLGPEDVSPAPAGMIPIRYNWSVDYGCEPRTRGDDPWDKIMEEDNIW